MKLGSDQLNKLAVERLAGKPQSITGREADEFLKSLDKDIKEAKKNAPNVHMEPEALTGLKGRGDGYFRDRTSPRARRIQVQALKTDD